MEPTFPTIGVIANRLGSSIHQVRYVIASRRIEPKGRAGNARVFGEDAVDRIRAELLKITKRTQRDASNT